MREIVRVPRLSWLAGVMLFLSGCGVGGSANPADPTRARDALHAMLDAWKSGEKPEDLTKRTPSIHVKDMDWVEGFRLVAYTDATEGKLVGYDMNYPVVLELTSPKGKTVKKTAVYTVTTQPELVVSRQEG